MLCLKINRKKMKNINILIHILFATLLLSCTSTSTVNKSLSSDGSTTTKVSKNNLFGSQDLATLKEEWQYETLVEEGEAPVLSKYKEDSRNKLLAKKGALLEAQRKLAEKVGTIRLNSTTTMKDFSTVDVVQSRLNVFLKDVEIIDETYDSENKIYKVTVQMPKLKVINVLEEYLNY